MKYLTRSVFIFICSLLPLLLCQNASWAQQTDMDVSVEYPPVASASNSTLRMQEIVIDRIFDPNVDLGWLPIIPLGSDITAVLPSTVYGYYSQYGLVECPVVWHASSINTPGRHTIQGTVSAPEGYYLKPNSGLETTFVNVAVYLEDPVVFFDVTDESEKNIRGVELIPLGADFTLPHNRMELISPHGDFIRTEIQWDLSSLSTDQVGPYTITGTPIMPPGAALTDPDLKISKRLYVMEPDTVDLGAYTIEDGLIICDWLTAINPQLATLQISVDGRNWLPAEEAIPGYDYQVFGSWIMLDTTQLEIDREYSFRLLYKGRWDGVLNLIFTNAHTPVPNWKGDRDGGDSGGSNSSPGDHQQKPPSSNGHTFVNQTQPQETVAALPDDLVLESQVPNQPTTTESRPATTPPTQSSATVQPKDNHDVHITLPAPALEESQDFMEVSTQNEDLISGTRLLIMLENEKQARFSKHGITVSFSAQAFEKLHIKDSDQIRVTIQTIRANEFTYLLTVNDVPVTDMPNTLLMLPYSLQEAESVLSLVRQPSDQTIEGSYDTSLAVASFLVDHTGTFTIIETLSEKEDLSIEALPTAPHIPIWPAVLVAVLALLLTLGVLLYKRKNL